MKSKKFGELNFIATFDEGLYFYITYLYYMFIVILLSEDVYSLDQIFYVSGVIGNIGIDKDVRWGLSTLTILLRVIILLFSLSISLK